MSSPPAPTFGLVAEGPTDFELIRHLLAGYFRNADIDPRLLQPRPDSSDAGGWSRVLAYCASDDFCEAFQFVDYVVVQIDTDVCEEAGYDVSRRDDDGRELAPGGLIDAARKRLIAQIGEPFYRDHEHAIIFAIAVDSSECWLLPAAYPNRPKTAAKTKNCLATLNQALAPRGITIDAGHKQVKYFGKALRALDSKRKLHTMGDKNPSLGAFIRELDARFCPTSGVSDDS